jgi:hypothetical protein
MPKRHTTAANWLTWVHSLVLAAIAIAIAMYVPYAGSAIHDFVSARGVNLGILFSMTVGFLMYKSLTRRSDIDHYTALELNKVRRIYHLAKHIAKAQPKASAWLAAVRGGVHEYLGLFRTFTFRQYELGDPLFRHITYAVYSLPSVTKTYNSELYDSLLEASGQATEAREFIHAKKDDTVSLFSWFVVAFIALAFGGVIVSATPADAVVRGIGALAIFCMFLVLQLIYEHDRANHQRDRAWADRYVTDLESLERAEKMH